MVTSISSLTLRIPKKSSSRSGNDVGDGDSNGRDELRIAQSNSNSQLGRNIDVGMDIDIINRRAPKSNSCKRQRADGFDYHHQGGESRTGFDREMKIPRRLSLHKNIVPQNKRNTNLNVRRCNSPGGASSSSSGSGSTCTVTSMDVNMEIEGGHVNVTGGHVKRQRPKSESQLDNPGMPLLIQHQHNQHFQAQLQLQNQTQQTSPYDDGQVPKSRLEMKKKKRIWLRDLSSAMQVKAQPPISLSASHTIHKSASLKKELAPVVTMTMHATTTPITKKKKTTRITIKTSRSKESLSDIKKTASASSGERSGLARNQSWISKDDEMKVVKSKQDGPASENMADTPASVSSSAAKDVKEDKGKQPKSPDAVRQLSLLELHQMAQYGGNIAEKVKLSRRAAARKVEEKLKSSQMKRMKSVDQNKIDNNSSLKPVIRMKKSKTKTKRDLSSETSKVSQRQRSSGLGSKPGSELTSWNKKKEHPLRISLKMNLSKRKREGSQGNDTHPTRGVVPFSSNKSKPRLHPHSHAQGKTREMKKKPKPPTVVQIRRKKKPRVLDKDESTSDSSSGEESCSESESGSNSGSSTSDSESNTSSDGSSSDSNSSDGNSSDGTSSGSSTSGSSSSGSSSSSSTVTSRTSDSDRESESESDSDGSLSDRRQFAVIRRKKKKVKKLTQLGKIKAAKAAAASHESESESDSDGSLSDRRQFAVVRRKKSTGGKKQVKKLTQLEKIKAAKAAAASHESEIESDSDGSLLDRRQFAADRRKQSTGGKTQVKKLTQLDKSKAAKAAAADSHESESESDSDGSLSDRRHVAADRRKKSTGGKKQAKKLTQLDKSKAAKEIADSQSTVTVNVKASNKLKVRGKQNLKTLKARKLEKTAICKLEGKYGDEGGVKKCTDAPKVRALTASEVRRILAEDDVNGGSSRSWVRRSTRQPSRSAINSPNVRAIVGKLEMNDPDMIVLKCKKYLSDPDTPSVIVDAMLDALERNTNCQALYIQNFNYGMKDEQVLHLIRILQQPSCKIWCLNIGETYDVQKRTWARFTNGLEKTNVTHMYASEHTISGAMKEKIRETIRSNRKKHDLHVNPNNLNVIVQCTHCWWNPINARVLQPYVRQRGYEHILFDKVAQGAKDVMTDSGRI